MDKSQYSCVDLFCGAGIFSRDFLKYYLLSFLVSPLVMTIIALCVKKIDTQEDDIASNNVTFDNSIDVNYTIDQDNNTTNNNKRHVCYCRKCGKQLIENSKYCNQCGTEVL